MSDEKVNLFIYGSLRDPAIFKSVSGLGYTVRKNRVNEENLFAEPAFLPQYRRVSPDNVYFYAIPDKAGKIGGYVVYGVSSHAMAEIDRFEGRRYDQEAVQVNTANGVVDAQAYLAKPESMKKHFGDRFHVNLIHELWLRKRIEKFIRKRTRPGERTVDAELERKAQRELLATTERDLVMSHYRTDAVSDFYLEHELDRPRPGIRHLYKDQRAQAFVENYLALVVRQVLLNQLEDMIQYRYRFELEHMRDSERYFKRSVSLLAALRMINANTTSVDMITRQCLDTMPYEKHELIDYVKYAVKAAQSLFDPRVAQAHLNRISTSRQPGLVPLGCEIELSNLGHRAITPQLPNEKAIDPIFDGFRYFHDFHLDTLSWKLGGYIDNHTGSTDLSRRTGFLELAPGRLNLASELSRPATGDPWILNQLIRAITSFYDIKPHSLHLSFQLRRKQIGKQEVLPLGFVKCLLVLGGGPKKKPTGRLWVSRMGYDEIKQYSYGEELVFARTNKRSWYLADPEIIDTRPAQVTTYVQQYKFIRLEKRATYEPLIMCLKGLQLAYNPGDYLTFEQLKASSRLQREYDELKQWAAVPDELDAGTINSFIKTVRDGLMNEGHHRPVHRLHYIDWALNAVKGRLKTFNKKLKDSLNGQ